MIARSVYAALTAMAAPAIDHMLARRVAAGKEDPERLCERHGTASRPRPDGPLVWIHAASNGEAMSALPLIERVLERGPRGHVLATTGTLTSARLLAERLPERAIHQFVPIDRTAWVSRFLEHWRPDAAIWVESEFWPALIWETRRRGIPTALVNGRVSKRSLGRWRRMPGLSRDLLSAFRPCLAQSEDDAQALRGLGADHADFVGNLKRSGAPLPVDQEVFDADRGRIGVRPVWLAASTHPGEEEIVLDAHRILQTEHPGLLTILVPRHPARGPEIAKQFEAAGLTVARRAAETEISDRSAVLIADTLGELGLFYRLAPVALIGGSLEGGHGGHNPLEAARLGCVPLFGSDMANFKDVASELIDAGGGLCVKNAGEVAATVSDLLSNAERCRTMAESAGRIAKAGTQAVDRVMGALEDILPKSRSDARGGSG